MVFHPLSKPTNQGPDFYCSHVWHLQKSREPLWWQRFFIFFSKSGSPYLQHSPLIFFTYFQFVTCQGAWQIPYRPNGPTWIARPWNLADLNQEVANTNTITSGVEHGSQRISLPHWIDFYGWAGMINFTHHLPFIMKQKSTQCRDI